MYDAIVVGAGIAGSVAARKLAEEGRKKVLVLERRDHIGGNCYDCADEHGVWIHQYGPHIFHTNQEDVYEYLSRYTQWNHFGHKVVARVGEQLIPVPFNLETLRMVYGEEEGGRLEQRLIERYGYGTRVSILKLRENEDPQIRAIADYVYEHVFLYYTMKQWGKKPEEIDRTVFERVPVLISHDCRYFQDKYQGMPRDGYTAMFERMLDHPNIEICCGVDSADRLSFADGKIRFRGEAFGGVVIYTGAADELLEYRYGDLPYRTLDFVFEHYDREDFQGHSVVNYTVSEEFTRITEFKHLTGQQDADGTTIVKEYPGAYQRSAGHIPYYPIANPENERLFTTYRDAAGQVENLYLLGRLAEYQYYNIDAMAKKAMDLADALNGRDEENGGIRR